LFACNEKIIIRSSIVRLIVKDVVFAKCIAFSCLIYCLDGHEMREVMLEFKKWYGLPSIHRAIDCVQITILNPKLSIEDYYYYKHGRYLMVAQCVVDNQK
jgi:hypothetical protein